jgi:hypothetical protein
MAFLTTPKKYLDEIGMIKPTMILTVRQKKFPLRVEREEQIE